MDVSGFEGSAVELRWNVRDLQSLASTLELVHCRRVAVQAGGCLGVFPKYLSRHFRTVYTFEPSPDLFLKMTSNAPEDNIVRFQAALGAEPGMVRTRCTLPPGKETLHEGMTRVEPGGPIPTMRVDDLRLDSCDLIYLDVEGHELHALRGAAATIEQHRPIVACEVNNRMRDLGIEPEDLHGWMTDAGYEHVATYRSDRVFAPRATP